MYIHGIYSDIYIFKEYTMYIPCIYMAWHTQWHLHIQGIFYVYTMYIQCIYMDIHGISCAYAPPGGWCCRGGQGPIPPAPPAMTSPGWIITLIFLHSCIHWRYLLLAKWMRRARLELKIAGKCSAWQARHTNWSSLPSVIPVFEVVPKTTTIKQMASRCGCWNKE